MPPELASHRIAAALLARSDSPDQGLLVSTSAVSLLAQFGDVGPASFAKIRHTSRGVAITSANLQPVIDIAAKYNAIAKAYAAQEMICTCALRR